MRRVLVHLAAVLALLIACTSDGATVADVSLQPAPSPSPTATAAPASAAPTPRLVDLRADQVIIPLNEMPLAGYKVASDAGHAYYWRRTFDPLARAGAEYAYIDVAVTIAGGATQARGYLDEWGCKADVRHGGTQGDKGPKSATVVSAPASGDASFACAYAWDTGDGKFDYVVAARNVYVWVQIAPFRSASLTQSATLGHAVEVARRQLAIIDRVSPP